MTCHSQCFLSWLGSLGSQPNYWPCGIVGKVEVQTQNVAIVFPFLSRQEVILRWFCSPSQSSLFTTKSVRDFLKTPGKLARLVWIILISIRGLRKQLHSTGKDELIAKLRSPCRRAKDGTECSKLRPLPTSPQPSQEPRDLKGSQPWLLHIHMAVPGSCFPCWTCMNHMNIQSWRCWNICFHGVLLVTARLESLRIRCRG